MSDIPVCFKFSGCPAICIAGRDITVYAKKFDWKVSSEEPEGSPCSKISHYNITNQEKI
jgi:hypothetical protein